MNGLGHYWATEPSVDRRKVACIWDSKTIKSQGRQANRTQTGLGCLRRRGGDPAGAILRLSAGRQPLPCVEGSAPRALQQPTLPRLLGEAAVLGGARVPGVPGKVWRSGSAPARGPRQQGRPGWASPLPTATDRLPVTSKRPPARIRVPESGCGPTGVQARAGSRRGRRGAHLQLD